MYTIKDVAKKANVSTATVSRIINNLPGYSEKTKKKVLEAIKELNYQPNALARGLINRRTHTIGVILPHFLNSYATQLLNGIEKKAHELGSSVIFCQTESFGIKTMKYLQVLNEKRVDGLIFISSVLEKEYYEYIEKIEMPLVLLSTKSDQFKVPYIEVDGQAAIYSAVQYLIEKGHRKIGMIGNKEDPIAGVPRVKGYKAALKAYNIPFESNRLTYSRGFSYEDGVKHFQILMKKAPDITAVVTISDEIGVGVLTAAHKMGIKVPDDVSVIGYDNLSIAEMSIPKLTSVAQPLERMGEKAAEKLFEILATESPVENCIMPHDIIERESVRTIKYET